MPAFSRPAIQCGSMAKSSAKAAHNSDALVDEIVTEARDHRIGDYATIFDLWIDEANSAELCAAFAKLFAIDPHWIAGLEKAGMPFRHAQPQHEILFGHGGDRFTG